MQKGWGTEWRESQPVCSGSVDTISLALSSSVELTPHFGPGGPAGLLVGGLVDIRAWDRRLKGLTLQK